MNPIVLLRISKTLFFLYLNSVNVSVVHCDFFFYYYFFKLEYLAVLQFLLNLIYYLTSNSSLSVSLFQVFPFSFRLLQFILQICFFFSLRVSSFPFHIIHIFAVYVGTCDVVNLLFLLCISSVDVSEGSVQHRQHRQRWSRHEACDVQPSAGLSP